MRAVQARQITRNQARQSIGLYGAPDRKLDVALARKFAGSGFKDLRFDRRGELVIPLPAGS